MGIAVLLAVATATLGSDVLYDGSDSPYSVITNGMPPWPIEGKTSYNSGKKWAQLDASCPMIGQKMAPERSVDVILAIDTSYCNHLRIDQVKATSKDLLDTLTNNAHENRVLGDNIRISLVTFNSQIEVIYAFSNYDRGDSSLRRLETELQRLSFTDDTTNYDNVFDELSTMEYEYGSFRSKADRYLIIYSNGNQLGEPNYYQMKENLKSMDVKVLGMSYSPQCSGRPSDVHNLDKVCANHEFYSGIGADVVYYAPTHGTMMDISNIIFNPDSQNSIDSQIAMQSNIRNCETGFPVNNCETIPGPAGRAGQSGPRGSEGQSGYSGENGIQGPDGHDGPQGLSGAQGDRGHEGRAGRPGNVGVSGSNGNEGARGRKGPIGRPGQSYEGPAGQAGVDGPSGSPGVSGQIGSVGIDGTPGRPGSAGTSGNRGSPGRSGNDGVPGRDGANAVCLAGTKGTMGGPGLPGESGMSGNSGENGRAGSNGRNGVRGKKGANGPRGLRGEKGKKGTTGPTGETGVDGVDGQRGLSGLPGAKGNRGPHGEIGRPGIPGDFGNEGKDGRQGEKGYSGGKGQNGEKGSPGPCGCSGEDGETGEVGMSGSDGGLGPRGVKGPCGENGRNGPKGPAGDPAVLDPKQVEILVMDAIRELLAECNDNQSGGSNGHDGTDYGRTDDIDEQF